MRCAEVLFAGTLIAATFAAWVVMVLVLGLSIDPAEPLTARTLVRELLDYPYSYVFWAPPNELPLAAAVPPSVRSSPSIGLRAIATQRPALRCWHWRFRSSPSAVHRAFRVSFATPRV